MMIAVWTKNRFFVRETAWYFDLLEKKPHLRSSYGLPPEHLTMLYSRINAKLRHRQGAAIAYLEMVREIGKSPRMATRPPAPPTRSSDVLLGGESRPRIVGPVSG